MAKKKSETKDNAEFIAEHFGSAATGFSNPNAEEKEVEEAPAPAEETTISPEEDEDLRDDDILSEELSYAERLEKLEIDSEKAYDIIDSMCEDGAYLAPYIIRKERNGKPEVKAVLMTRDTRTQSFIVDHVSKYHQNIPMIYNKLMGELQLAASLIHYNGTSYTPLVEIEDDKEFEEELLRRVGIFSKLPAPITVVLLRNLTDFDLEVAAVMAPGYEDFF